MSRYGRLMDWDPESRVAVYHHYDHDTRTTTITEVQDHKPFIERNKLVQRAGIGKGSRLGLSEASRRMIADDWWWVASIPVGVQYQWLRLHGVNIYNRDHWPKVRKLLNSPEYRYLRTGTGRV